MDDAWLSVIAEERKAKHERDSEEAERKQQQPGKAPRKPQRKRRK